VEGRDLIPLLKGQPGFDKDRPLFWHQPHQWGAPGPGIWPFTSIRDGDWKLIYFHAGRRFELYNLAQDIGETTDLAQQQPARVRDLAAKLDAWIEQAGVQLSIDKYTGMEVERPGAVALRVGDHIPSEKKVPRD
jgi:arylsulfatase A-like enzyme